MSNIEQNQLKNSKDEWRSFVHKKHWWLRKNPQADAHVRLYVNSFNPIQRSMWTCPRCGSIVRNMDRLRHEDGRLAKHCGCKTPLTKRMTPEQYAAHKHQLSIELKRKYRMAAAEKAGRFLMVRINNRGLHDAHVADFKSYTKAQIDAPKHLYDAHVKRYKYLLNAKEKYAKKYANNPQAERDRTSRYKEALPDPYVIQNLKVMGIPSHAITPSLIAMKREAMQYGRLSREIKSTVKTYLKDNHETIPKHP